MHFSSKDRPFCSRKWEKTTTSLTFFEFLRIAVCYLFARPTIRSDLLGEQPERATLRTQAAWAPSQ